MIAGGASPEFRTMTIDKGTSDGLRPDMAVIAPAGVVGRIILPTGARGEGAAAHRPQCRGRRDGRAVAGAGRGGGHRNGSLRLDHVPGTADVKVGDRVVTSGIDGIYPRALSSVR